MNQFVRSAADLIAITLLVVMYFVGTVAATSSSRTSTANVGVLAVSSILGTGGVGLSVGFGLFGVLSDPPAMNPPIRA